MFALFSVGDVVRRLQKWMSGGPLKGREKKNSRKRGPSTCMMFSLIFTVECVGGLLFQKLCRYSVCKSDAVF